MIEDLKKWTREYQSLSESSHLDKFVDMVDYENGDPSSAAKRLQQALQQLRTAVETAKEEAGEFIGPGVMAAFKKDLAAVVDER